MSADIGATSQTSGSDQVQTISQAFTRADGLQATKASRYQDSNTATFLACWKAQFDSPAQQASTEDLLGSALPSVAVVDPLAAASSNGPMPQPMEQDSQSLPGTTANSGSLPNAAAASTKLAFKNTHHLLSPRVVSANTSTISASLNSENTTRNAGESKVERSNSHSKDATTNEGSPCLPAVLHTPLEPTPAEASAQLGAANPIPAANSGQEQEPTSRSRSDVSAIRVSPDVGSAELPLPAALETPNGDSGRQLSDLTKAATDGSAGATNLHSEVSRAGDQNTQTIARWGIPDVPAKVADASVDTGENDSEDRPAILSGEPPNSGSLSAQKGNGSRQNSQAATKTEVRDKTGSTEAGRSLSPRTNDQPELRVDIDNGQPPEIRASHVGASAEHEKWNSGSELRSRNASASFSAALNTQHGLQEIKGIVSADGSAGQFTGHTGQTANPPVKSDEANFARTGAEEAFTALDTASRTHSDDSQLARTAHAQAEVGYQDPALGWIAVRGASNGNAIHAVVVPSTADAAQALSVHMAGLHTHLADNRTPVETLTLVSAGSTGLNADGSTGQNPRQSSGQDSQQDAPADSAYSLRALSSPARGRTLAAALVAEGPSAQMDAGTLAHSRYISVLV